MAHVLSPHSKGLFSGAIMQSGVMLQYGPNKHPAYYAR